MLRIIRNPNEDIYNKVTKAVLDNHSYCPCSLVKNENTMCMCKNFREQYNNGIVGECHCGRYVVVDTEGELIGRIFK